jgi:catecholate siderophore receptor
VSIFNPDPYDPATGYAPQPTQAFSKGRTGTASAYVFDTISVGARWQFSGGARLERYGTDFLTVDATGATTTNAHASGNIVSGKAGVMFKINQSGNVYVSFGSTVTPPGTANFTLSTQVNNQNNPDVKPQTSKNYEIGSKWDLAGSRLALNAAAFRTDNKNVVYTVDGTAIPPVYNQDDARR